MMKLLHICIYIGIFLFLVDLSLAKKKKDENVLVERKNEKSDPEIFIRSKIKKSESKDDGEEDDESDGPDKDDEDDISDHNDLSSQKEKFIYVCKTEDSESICTCKNETLDCHKQLIGRKLLNQTYVKIRDQYFIVKTANFNNNGIKILKKGYVIPDNVATVKRLMFSHNHIAIIENHVFDAFVELGTLEISFNLLKDIDDHILTRKLGETLQNLHLDHNKFQKFSPKTFIHLHNLLHLHINNNPITKFSKETFPEALSNLKYLQIGNCNIKTLDDDVFENLKNLHDLILAGNPITSVPKALNGIPHLVSLDLSNTNIQKLDTNAFDKDSLLNDISFLYNPNLTSIEDCAFCGLSKLTKLGFMDCKNLSYIHENAFGALRNKKVPQIESIFLCGTNITVLPEKLLNWENVKEISVWRNNLACNCSMAWLINDISMYKTFTSTVPICASPPEFAGLTFTEVSGTICLDNDLLKSDSIFWPLMFFVAALICILAFLCYSRRARKIIRPDLSQMTYRNLSAQQQHEDEEELQAHF